MLEILVKYVVAYLIITLDEWKLRSIEAKEVSPKLWEYIETRLLKGYAQSKL